MTAPGSFLWPEIVTISANLGPIGPWGPIGLHGPDRVPKMMTGAWLRACKVSAGGEPRRPVSCQLGTKYLVPSTWYQVLGTKYLAPTRYLVPSAWYQVFGSNHVKLREST